MTKNKYAHPPYLPKFDYRTAIEIKVVAGWIDEASESPSRLIGLIEDLTDRPSRIRKCDLPFLKPIVELINQYSKFKVRSRKFREMQA